MKAMEQIENRTTCIERGLKKAKKEWDLKVKYK